MRNINELIGIIQGVNYDGVVNELEIERLQTWVDKNRNLAYSQEQSELIELVDEVLEDHVITEDEKVRLVDTAKKFLESAGDNSCHIYELNGIIEGIICDGVVNEAEILCLREWMAKYGMLVTNHKSMEQLYNAINDVLADGTVTEDEQRHMLVLLSGIIHKTQFETKLDYLCRQVRVRKNIGTDLIDILDNEAAITKIHNRAEAQLLKSLMLGNSNLVGQEIIVISLILIAMLEYDGNYYENVRSTYTKIYQRFSEQKVEGCIRSILSRYKKAGESGSRSRIINVALENAIVPEPFLSAFFEFIFDIYKLNFEYDLPDEPYEDFRFVYEGLRSNMRSSGDDISINVTQKTYKLIAATKQLILKEEGLDAVIKLSIIIIKLIDKRFWNKDVKIFNPYLKAGYEGWEKQLKDSSQGSKDHKGGVTSELRSRWEPKFLFCNNDICLIPPVHRVKAQYDYRSLAVVVLNDGHEIYRNNNCYVKEIIGGYQINPPKIKVDQPLGKLSYRLVAGKEIIYDSKDRLCREYIVFNDVGQEISNNTDYEGTAYVCHNTNMAALPKIYSDDYYSIGFKLVHEGDAIAIGHDVFNFSSMAKPGIFGQLHKNCFVSEVDTGSMLPVYKEVSMVAFEVENISSKHEVIINDQPYKIADLQHKKTVRGNIAKYVVSLNLPMAGLYTVEVNQINSGKKSRVLRESFAYDPDLLIEIEKIDADLHRVKITSGFFMERFDSEISSDEFNLDMIRFQYSDRRYSYLLPMNLGFYSVNDDVWKQPSEDLWIEDIPLDATLKLYDSECDGLVVYTEKGILAEDGIAVQDHGYYKSVAIGFLNSYKASNRRVMLVFTVAGKMKYLMFCYNKCELDDESTKILFSDNPKKIMITPIYHGKNKVFFEVFNKNMEKVFTSKPMASGQTEVLEEFDSFEEYTINFHEKTKILMLRKNTLLYQVKKTFYARQDYVGKVFKIDTAYYDQLSRGQYIERHYYFNKAYVRIKDFLEDGLLLGEIFVKTIRGEWLLDNINPVEIEICSDIIDDTMDVYITNCGDGLLLDFEKHGILNALEHPTAPDIFLYTVRMKEED